VLSVRVACNVLALCEGGDYETPIQQVEQKRERTTQGIVTVNPRFCKTSVVRSFLSLYYLLEFQKMTLAALLVQRTRSAA
jgi:hypothetical protein